MSTTSSIPKPELEKDTVVCGWKVIRKLGCGGFGSVYEVEKDGMSAALKTEFIDQEGERSETLRNEAITDLHNTGILHRDIKASNFAWSLERRVYLLDLGFCRRFLVWRDGKIVYRLARKRAPFLGTSKYCSINVHRRIEQGRRDDLWGWLYMVVEFFAGRLIWRNDDDEVIVKKKENIGSNLLKRCPQEMFIIYDHIRSLEYTSKPNYGLMRRQLEKGGRYFAEFKGCSDTEKEMSDDGRKTLQTARHF
uniref:Protein kinase domain-containing protein n=1 Tax=Heterorhabditis bacteriophora TaxID=37862 RepID=A0A1I7XQS5_HETBA